MSIPEEDTLSLGLQASREKGCSNPLIAALQPHGVRLIDGVVDRQIPVLLALENVGDDDLAAVARLSGDGQRRLIVALSKPAVGGAQLDWQLLALGASEVLSWSEILADPANLCARLRRWRAIDDIVFSLQVRKNLIGSSPAWRKLLRLIVEVACFTTSPVLLIGQGGTGKRRLARLIHTLNEDTAKGNLVVLDCTRVVPELSGSEFFGNEWKGLSKTYSARDGAFAMAHQGTLFLDNVDKLPVAIQPQLLRVLDKGTFKRLGSNLSQPTEFRLICATCGDLWSQVNKGSFRPDLYHSLAEWVFQVPSLAERRDDILPLARYFLRHFCPGLPDAEFAPNVAAWLQSRHYPDNIHDLRRLLVRICARHVGKGPIGLADIPEDERPDISPQRAPWPDPLFKHAIDRAVTLGIQPEEISRTASDLAVQATMRSQASMSEADRGLRFGGSPELPDANADPAAPAAAQLISNNQIEPVPRPPLVLRPAQIASHTGPMPSDGSHLPRPIPRNSDIPRNTDQE